MPMFKDTNMVVRDGSTDLDADLLSAAFVLGRMKAPLYLHIEVPEGGASMTLDIAVQVLDTTYKNYITWPQITTAPGEEIFIPVLLPKNFTTVKINFDVGGTSPDFGAVKAAFILKPRYDN